MRQLCRKILNTLRKKQLCIGCGADITGAKTSGYCNFQYYRRCACGYKNLYWDKP